MLIQKDVKPNSIKEENNVCLRALLIQKDVKLSMAQELGFTGLRALLIQKDVKPFPWFYHSRVV